MDAPEKRRWYCPTPGWLVLGSLVVTGLLWLSNWLGWPAWHKGYAVLVAVAGVGTVLAVMLLWWLVALIFRWRFQLGIRTLLVLTLAVALPFSWLAVEMRKAREQKGAVAAIKELGRGVTIIVTDPPQEKWVRSLLGEDYFCSVTGVVLPVFVTHGDPLRMRVDWTVITDADLEHLKGLGQLRKLYLGGPGITDHGLEHLKGLNQLQELQLICTAVTDRGTEELQKALPKCKIIHQTDPFEIP